MILFYVIFCCPNTHVQNVMSISVSMTPSFFPPVAFPFSFGVDFSALFFLCRKGNSFAARPCTLPFANGAAVVSGVFCPSADLQSVSLPST